MGNNLFQSKRGKISTASLFQKCQICSTKLLSVRVVVVILDLQKIEIKNVLSICKECSIVFTREMRVGLVGRALVVRFSNGILKIKSVLDTSHLIMLF